MDINTNDKPWFDLYPLCPNFIQKNVRPDPMGHDCDSYSFCTKRNTDIIPFIHCKKCLTRERS